MKNYFNQIKPKYKRLNSIIISVVFAACGLWFILDSFNQNIVFFLTPTEFKEQYSNTINKKLNNNSLKRLDIIRVGGMVKENSVIKLDDGLTTRFTITDTQTDLIIQYTGLLPSLFREKQGIVAKGKLSNNIFIAEEILAKHDENYMPKEVTQGYMKLSK